jgi:hypothetical protein
MDIYERLNSAAKSKESITIIYNGGSQPGRKRRIIPALVTSRVLHAKDISTGEMKTYIVEKIEVVTEDSPAKEYVAGETDLPHYSSLMEAFERRIEELRSLGWHVDLTEDGISLCRYFKNGNLRKSPEVGLHKRIDYNTDDFEEFYDTDKPIDTADSVKERFSIPIGDHLVHLEAELRITTKQIKSDPPRPWYVFGPGLDGRSFGHLDRAVALFWDQAKKYAPKCNLDEKK